MNGGEPETATKAVDLAPSSSSAHVLPTAKHKQRSLSAGLLQRFSFLRRPPVESSTSAPAALSMQAAVTTAASTTTAEDEVQQPLSRPSKSRMRKGSLRKTALLGPGRVKQDASTSSPATDIHSRADAQSDDAVRSIDQALHDALAAAQDMHHPRRLSFVSEHSPTSSPPSIPHPPELASPIISPTSQSYASTTDDDDLSMAATVTRPTSYFHSPVVVDVGRRRSSLKHAPSPLSAVPVMDYNVEDGFDYAETERWGWVVLVVTWVVFAVGMGSCFGVWSWAWDVGSLPYAPPELEDDPTLPIVGYYPALIVLSSVMAWVWVVVAWVGMKYFKHAKIQGDD
jgi:hypothetical protein